MKRVKRSPPAQRSARSAPAERLRCSRCGRSLTLSQAVHFGTDRDGRPVYYCADCAEQEEV